ncbi:hypothetical protein A2U01_0062904 [Trifolium medium]|uniref:Uncharacterized protein n=1 Tax=Trifolium medium TaxID=97028 RepID=A0A392RYG8_9FABA|nr:hypothetical protein [Trifolium medium]
MKIKRKDDVAVVEGGERRRRGGYRRSQNGKVKGRTRKVQDGSHAGSYNAEYFSESVTVQSCCNNYRTGHINGHS